MICFHCHKPITGRYTTAMSQPWHPECFLCAGCGIRIDGQFVERDGKPYHSDCFQERFSPRCAIGGELLRAAYLTNEWGDVFCQTHQVDCPECFSCGRPICERLTNSGVRYPDGRTMCTRCRQTAIDQPHQGKPVVVQVRRVLARHGIDLKDAEAPVRLVTQPELDERNTANYGAKGYAHQPCGMTCTSIHTEGGRVVKRTVAEILILRGLPVEHFASIVAHELGHMWLFLNDYPRLPPSVEEGVCELCNSLWLRDQSTDAARRRLKMMQVSDNDIYGRGYRAASKALERLPLPTLLAFVRQQKRFP